MCTWGKFSGLFEVRVVRDMSLQAPWLSNLEDEATRFAIKNCTTSLGTRSKKTLAEVGFGKLVLGISSFSGASGLLEPGVNHEHSFEWKNLMLPEIGR